MSVRLPQAVLQGQAGGGGGGEGVEGGAAFLGGALPARAVRGDEAAARLGEWADPWGAVVRCASPFALHPPRAEEAEAAARLGVEAADAAALRVALRAAGKPHERVLLVLAAAGALALLGGLAGLLAFGKLYSLAVTAALLPGWVAYTRIEARYNGALEGVLVDWLRVWGPRRRCALLLVSARLRRPGARRRGARAGTGMGARGRALSNRPHLALFELEEPVEVATAQSSPGKTSSARAGGESAGLPPAHADHVGGPATPSDTAPLLPRP